MGNHLFQFQYVVNNIIKTQQCSKIDNPDKETEFLKLREKYMYDNFSILYNKFPKGKYYGQFGLEHVLQHKSSITESFAARISNNNSKLKGKVYSIGYVYEQCEGIAFGSDGKYHTYILDNGDNFDAFNLNNDVTLFRLNEQNSPFRTKLIWPYYDSIISPIGGVLTDYLQGIVVIKGFGASGPINDKYN